MVKFNLADLKKKSANELANIRDYGHPSYSFFGTVLSNCKRFEMTVDVNCGPLNLSTGKSAYRIDVNLYRLPEGVDLDSDDAMEGAELVSSIEGRVCRSKAEIWTEMKELAEDAE